MHNEKKPFHRNIMFWPILIAVLVVAGLVIGIAVSLRHTPQAHKKPGPNSQALETTAEPTLPPPPKNPYGPSDFYLENGYMTCGAGPTTLGIDVSYWQGNIDWEQVKQAGVEFAIIRVGFRGSNEGALDTDSYARQNYEGAKAAGIKVGAYIFSQAITPEEAVEEAEFLLEQTQGWEMEMPVVFDWEFVSDESRTANMTGRQMTDCAIAFSERIRQAGHEPMVYFSSHRSHRSMILEELKDYKFWLAMYDSVMDYPYRVDFWQYTESGKVPGIQGDVDINLWFHYDEE